MRKYKIFIVLLALFLVVGASCNLGGLVGKGESGSEVKDDDYTGAKGLVLSFAQGLPPTEIWKDVDFSVQIDAHNQGGDDVSEGKVCIGSFPDGTFSGNDGCEDIGETIVGRRNFPGGEIQTYGRDKWDFKLKKGFDVDKDYVFTAKACYKYSTSLAPSICIKDPFADARDTVCSAGELDVGSDQAGPVAVTFLKEDIIPKGDTNELLFTIKVKNVGDGEVIKHDEGLDDKCSFDNRNQKDVVKVEILSEESGFSDASCKNDGELHLRNGEGSIICRGIEVEKGDSYTLPLNIKLTYSYLSRLKGQFKINREIGGE
jgi:hypothetical protein